MRQTKLRSSDARNEGQSSLEKWRKDRNEECVGLAQWKINQPPSLRDNARAWREPTLFMVCDGRTHIGMNQADLEKEDCRQWQIARRDPMRADKPSESGLTPRTLPVMHEYVSGPQDSVRRSRDAAQRFRDEPS